MILGAAGRAADRVYLERQVLDSEESEYLGGEGDYLASAAGAGVPKTSTPNWWNSLYLPDCGFS